MGNGIYKPIYFLGGAMMILEWSSCKKTGFLELHTYFPLLSSFDEEIKDCFSLCNSTVPLSPIFSTISTAVLKCG